MRTIRDGVGLSTSAKAVGMCLALHARPDGTNAHPGINRLAWEAQCSRRTVITALQELEGLGLIYCIKRGSMIGATGAASNYTLATHADLSRITTTFEQWCEINSIGHPAQWPGAA